MSAFSDTIRLRGRQLANKMAGVFPKPLARHILKSFWQQPRLQDELGFHIQPYRYDSAIPTSRDVDTKKLLERRNIPGIQLDEGDFLQRLGSLQPFVRELDDIPLEYKEGAEFWLRNGSFGDFDATMLYCMLRHVKPGRLIEVGCGFSSRVIALACRRNAGEGSPCECIHIEPYPSDDLRRNPPPGKLLEKKIQEVPLSLFQTLQAGDILFIDTSHVLKTQSDCVYELLEILPTLKPGVFVHVHDIFTPFDYPAEWLLDRQFPFNEQYALECFLSLNPAFEIILPVYLLLTTHRKRMEEVVPRGNPKSLAGSFWIRKTN